MKKVLNVVIILVVVALVLNIITTITRFSLGLLGVCCWNLACLAWIIYTRALDADFDKCKESNIRLTEENYELRTKLNKEKEMNIYVVFNPKSNKCIQAFEDRIEAFDYADKDFEVTCINLNRKK